MRSRSTRHALPRALGILALAGVALAGCSWTEDIGDSLDSSNSKPHHVDTGAEGKESGLLADWVPDDASDVSVMQRTTGSERLLTFTYAGDMPADCEPIETVGAPTEAELEASYATDPRSAALEVDRWSTMPTLEADWWPEGQHTATTHLCGRWWVSAEDETFYAFAAEQS